MADYQIEAFNELEKQVVTGQQFALRDLLRLAVSLFNKYTLIFGHGTDNAYDEAVYLVLHTLNLPIDQLEPYLDAKLLPSEVTQLLAVLETRIIKRLPAAYITRQANFLDYTFYVDERVIIPRSYLAEIMLNGGLSQWIEHPELAHNVLDLCTGNGSLAIIAANYFYDSDVVASDISDDALEVAAINCNNYQLDDQITLLKSDLFSGLTEYRGMFDVILTNPPYVDEARMVGLPAEYLHEPRLALAGGDDGLIIVDRILKIASDYLTETGVLVLEMGDNQDELEEKYPGLNFNWLNTQNGAGVVFVLTYADLKSYFSQEMI